MTKSNYEFVNPYECNYMYILTPIHAHKSHIINAMRTKPYLLLMFVVFFLFTLFFKLFENGKSFIQLFLDGIGICLSMSVNYHARPRWISVKILHSVFLLYSLIVTTIISVDVYRTMMTGVESQKLKTIKELNNSGLTIIGNENIKTQISKISNAYQ